MSPNGGNELQMGPAGAPYSEEEIRSLQERGDFLGASSRITANQYALGHMYWENEFADPKPLGSRPLGLGKEG